MQAKGWHQFKSVLRIRYICILALWVCLGAMIAGAGAAEASALSRRIVVDTNSALALYGYDPVAYFTDRKAIRGKRTNEYVWRGVSWVFSSRANLEVFKSDPEVYAPRYGGHGALSMARGHASDSNPTIWAIYRDRLYFFYSFASRAAWAASVDLHVERGDLHWIKIEGTLAR